MQGCREHLGPRGPRKGGQRQGRRIIGLPSERLCQKQPIRLEVAVICLGAVEMPTWPRKRPPAARPRWLQVRSGVEAQRGQEAGCIMPGTVPHWPPADRAVGPAPDWLGIWSRRLIGYWLPLRSGLCHTLGRTWIWVLALG